jgi:hypothetical protein
MCKDIVQIIYFLCIFVYLDFFNVASLPLNIFEQKGNVIKKQAWQKYIIWAIYLHYNGRGSRRSGLGVAK